MLFVCINFANTVNFRNEIGCANFYFAHGGKNRKIIKDAPAVIYGLDFLCLRLPPHIRWLQNHKLVSGVSKEGVESTHGGRSEKR